MNDARQFDRCLKNLLTASGVSREKLARYLDVPVPVVNRWLNGIAAPDVYQFQAIAKFFGMPYDWFLNSGDRFPSAGEVAERLGLTEATVKAMMFVADSEDAAVMDAVNDAIWAVFSAVLTVYQGVGSRFGDAADQEDTE